MIIHAFGKNVVQGGNGDDDDGYEDDDESNGNDEGNDDNEEGDDPHDSYDEPHDDIGDGDDDDGGDGSTGGNQVSQQQFRDADATLEAEISSILNVDSCAGTESLVQETMEENIEYDDGINYSSNPDTSQALRRLKNKLYTISNRESV